MKAIILTLLSICIASLPASAIANPNQTTATEDQLPAPSSQAQRLYEDAQNDLLQIRVLLKNGRTQSSVGSGFLIGRSNLVVTNYHVISQIAMHPDNYIGEFVATNDERGSIKLIAVDTLHDLAVIQISRQGTGYFNIPKVLPSLTQGQYLYSLGNPLDLGFAISEGTYNGVIRRGFYERLMFTGAINAGMSGGPNITQQGLVSGVNVSKRLDGELVSFLVPVKHVRDLLVKAETQLKEDKPTAPQAFKKIIGQQLLTHQQSMANRILDQPFTLKNLGDYRVPVRESEQMRCWGNSNVNQDNPFRFSSINCGMESAIFVSNKLRVGYIQMRHEYIQSTELGKLRFSTLESESFENEQFGSHEDSNRTAPTCQESFVNNGKLPMRAVLCVRAYKEFADLYDFALLTAATDKDLVSLQSRLDANGVDYENGLRLTQAFLDSLQTVKEGAQ